MTERINFTAAVREKFWDRVEKSDGCWIWKPGPSRNDYGSLKIDGVTMYAHRVSWAMNAGCWPDGLVDHSCRNKLCVNPDHLRVVTRKQNAENMAVTSGSTSGYRGVSWDARNRK